MKRSTLTGSVAACILLGLAVPVLAAPPGPSNAASPPSASPEKLAATSAAASCLRDVRAFDTQMEKGGYWLGGSDYGYGYPIEGYGYSAPMGVYPAAAPAGTALSYQGYQTARPGYEIRSLIAAASILARHGQQQACESVLATTQGIYKKYAADLRDGNMPTTNIDAWRQQQVAGAQPVTDRTAALQSAELIGTDVRGAQGEALGSVEDLVMSPQTGKIAYMVVARGGIFGFDQTFVPVPWADFKITPNTNLLVLDTTKAALETAPTVRRDQFTTKGQFDQQSQKVDAYWKTHMSDKAKSASSG